MSRIGKLPIGIPKNVNVTLNGTKIEIKGPNGSLDREIPELIGVNMEDDKLKDLYRKLEFLLESDDQETEEMFFNLFKESMELLVHPFTNETFDFSDEAYFDRI